MNRKNIPTVLSIIIALLLNACATQAEKQPMVPVALAAPSKPVLAAAANSVPSDNLNAVLWQQTAAEYHAHSLQSFKQAQLALEVLLKQLAYIAQLGLDVNFVAISSYYFE